MRGAPLEVFNMALMLILFLIAGGDRPKIQRLSPASVAQVCFALCLNFSTHD